LLSAHAADIDHSLNTPLLGGVFPLPAQIRPVINDPASGHRKDRIIPRLRSSGPFVQSHGLDTQAAREHSMAAHLATGGVRFVKTQTGYSYPDRERVLRRFLSGDIQWDGHSLKTPRVET
jgi:hypothetical protein